METSLKEPKVQEMLAGKELKSFPSPQDWREQWVYFLLVDRFNDHRHPANPPQYPCNTYQGGTFEGIRQKLPYLKKLGAGVLWLSPVLKNPAWFNDYWGGYGIQNFIQIEPRFCIDPHKAEANPETADKEFRRLVDEAHAMGIYVIMDIVLNHVYDVFNYEGKLDSAPWNSRGEYKVYWRNDHGEAQGNWTEIEKIRNLSEEAGVYPVEFQHNDYFRRRGDFNTSGNSVYGDFGNLKELVTEYRIPGTKVYPVRDLLISSYQYLIAKFDIDGFRIDTLQFVEPDFARIFGNSIREFAQSIGKLNFYTVGEVWQDDEEDKIAAFIGRDTEKEGEFIGVDGAINFPLRKRLFEICKGFMPPVELANQYNKQRWALRKIISSHGDAGCNFMNFIDNHDVNARFHNPQYPDQTKIMLTCLMTMSGIPCLYYGTEQGLSGHGNMREYVREALWGTPNAFSEQHEMYKVIQDLSEVRHKHAALRYGRQYYRECSGNGTDFGYSPYEGGVLAYSRILNNHEMLVVANTSTSETSNVYVVVDENLSPVAKEWGLVYSTRHNKPGKVSTTLHNRIHAVKVPLQPMEAQIWE
jgi:glycosidase